MLKNRTLERLQRHCRLQPTARTTGSLHAPRCAARQPVAARDNHSPLNPKFREGVALESAAPWTLTLRPKAQRTACNSSMYPAWCQSPNSMETPRRCMPASTSTTRRPTDQLVRCSGPRELLHPLSAQLGYYLRLHRGGVWVGEQREVGAAVHHLVRSVGGWQGVGSSASIDT
jgi:hypothetical protein